MATLEPEHKHGQPRIRLKREPGTRALLDALLDGDEHQTLDFNALMHGLGRRARSSPGQHIHRPAVAVAGRAAVLPIPFTNYLLGGLILLFALALLERDGAMMLVAWGVGIITVGTTGALSGELVAAMQPMIDRIF